MDEKLFQIPGKLFLLNVLSDLMQTFRIVIKCNTIMFCLWKPLDYHFSEELYLMIPDSNLLWLVQSWIWLMRWNIQINHFNSFIVISSQERGGSTIIDRDLIRSCVGIYLGMGDGVTTINAAQNTSNDVAPINMMSLNTYITDLENPLLISTR